MLRRRQPRNRYLTPIAGAQYLASTGDDRRFVTEERIAAILLELRRIGVDFDALTEPLVATGLRASEMVDWLRAIPDGAGAEEWTRRLEEEGRKTRPPVEYRWRKEPPRSATLNRRERWWPTQALLDAGTDLMMEEWDPFGIRLAGTDREAIAMFVFHFFGPFLSPNGGIDPLTHTTEMIASAERDHLALRPSPEPHRRYLARRLRELVERYPVPPPEYRPPQSLVVVLDENAGPPPLDPEGVCARCHSFGTVARITTMSDPPRSARYCSTCWAHVRTELRGPPKTAPETAAERIALYDRMHRTPRTAFSRSWTDTLDSIRAVTKSLGSGEQPSEAQARAFARAVAEIVKMEEKMDGPMPAEVEAFVRQYAPPDA